MLEIQRETDETVFVGNLQSCVTEEILYELFLQAGPVKKVVIPRDREGRPRSFGFVYYKHAEAVPYAIELLDGIWLYGRPISLKYTFGNSHQACGAASPHLQNGLTGNSKFQPREEHSWTDLMSDLAFDPFLPVTPPAQGQLWPAVSTPASAALQWPWLDSGYASWITGSEEQPPACTMSKTDAEQSLESGKHQKSRRSHERRHKRKRRHKI